MKRIHLISIICYWGILFLIGGCKKESAPEKTIADQFTVTTLAGSGIQGTLDGPAATAQFDLPNWIAADAHGNVYLSDLKTHSIRKISTDGMVSTLAGGTRGTADGNHSAAQFIAPGELTVDAQNNIYVVDSMRIRKITPAGDVTTLATLVTSYNNLTGTFNGIGGIVADKQGNIFAIISYTSEIRKISPSGQVSTFLDSTQKFPTSGFLSSLHHIAIDASGNIYVTRNVFLGEEINEITPSKNITVLTSTYAINGVAVSPATGEVFFSGSSLACSSINSCQDYSLVSKVSSGGNYLTVAGREQGFVDGTGNFARFGITAGISADAQGNLYVADQLNNRIRKISKH